MITKLITVIILFSIIDCTAQDNQNKYSFTDDEKAAVFRDLFSNIANNNSKATVGSYGSTDIKDGNLVFNITKSFKAPIWLSLNANAGLTNGYSSVFKNSELNTNVQLDFELSALLVKDVYTFISVLYDSLPTIEEKYKYKFDTLIHKNKKDKLIREIESAKAETNILKNTATICDLMKHRFGNEAEILKLLNENSGKTHDVYIISFLETCRNCLISNQELKDSIITNYENLLDSLEKKEHHIDTLLSVFREMNTMPAIFEKQRQTERLDLLGSNIGRYSFGWINSGIILKNNTFNYSSYHDFELLNKGSDKVTYNSFYFNLNWNYFTIHKFSILNTYYYSLGFKLGIDDNFSSLTRYDYKEVYKYKEGSKYSDTSLERSSSKDIIAYYGDYKKDLLTLKLTGEFYKAVLDVDTYIHLFSEATFQNKSFPDLNAGVGLLLSYRDSKNQDAKLHSEIYLMFKDITNPYNKEDPFYKRIDAGIRLSLPINFFNI